MHQSRSLTAIRSVVIALLIAAVAHAQQPEKVPRIGYLTAGNPAANVSRLKALRQGLREIGYVE